MSFNFKDEEFLVHYSLQGEMAILMTEEKVPLFSQKSVMAHKNGIPKAHNCIIWSEYQSLLETLIYSGS